MSKAKLNIREMIRSGEIDTAKAGQLVSIYYYTGGDESPLTDSDIRALKETAKDARLYNAYMAGGRALSDGEPIIMTLSGEAKSSLLKLAWIGAEIKYTIETVYKEPFTTILTEEAYKRVGKTKRERRLKRTYTLVTLYRILAQELINYPKTKEDEALLADLKEYPDNAKEGWIYGIDLIDDKGKGEPTEYWRGWTAYYQADKLEGLDSLAEDIPKAHEWIMAKLRELHANKQLSIDIDSIDLSKAHTEALKGSELADMESSIQYLSDMLNKPEGTLLDEYRDEDETEDEASTRFIYETYQQVFIIIKNKDDINSKHLKDGIYEELEAQSLHRPLVALGYRDKGKEDSVASLIPLRTIKQSRQSLSGNLLLIWIYTYWRRKVAELVGVHKTETFKEREESSDAIQMYGQYYLYWVLLEEQINDTYIKPEYKEYMDKIKEAYKTIGDSSPEFIEKYREYLGASSEDNRKAKRVEPVEELIRSNPHVSKAIEYIDSMTIYDTENSMQRLRDIVLPIIRAYDNPSKLDDWRAKYDS